MRAENPAATWERGSRVTVHYSKNNHVGGFMRLTLVPLDEMMRTEAHEALAFHYSCWSSELYYCDNKEQHRDCGYDRDNLAYKTTITVPTIYPDGVYVLGWSWYGGGEGHGDYGDYYDCSYVRIQGGPLTDTYHAMFVPGPRYPDGCQAAVDRLGMCPTEPCPQDFWGSKKTPAAFHGGTPVLHRQWMEDARWRAGNQVQVAEPTDFGVTSFSLYDTGSERKLEVNLDDWVNLSGIEGITIVPEYFGAVEHVEWVVNGELESDRREWPFAIGGQQPHHHGHNFYAWPYPVFDKRVFVTAIAHSGGRRQYYSKELYFHRG